MNPSKLRRQIAYEAARLIYQRQESQYAAARSKAAKMVSRQRVPPGDMPSNGEILDEVKSMTRMLEGSNEKSSLLEMRIEALQLMRVLKNFRPRLVGSVLSGEIREGSDINLQLFSDSLESVRAALAITNLDFQVEHRLAHSQNKGHKAVHLHVQQQFLAKLIMYPANMVQYGFRNSVTGKQLARKTIAEFELFLQATEPDLDLEAELLSSQHQVDRFQLYEMLLYPLEEVQQNPIYHPEGDALYHSLQVFELARNELPYDEEFLLAALLHDIGKAIDPTDHVTAGLEALGETITARTTWLIEHHMTAHQIKSGSLGHKKLRRLQQDENFDDLMLLCQCDQGGRATGVPVMEVTAALQHIQELEQQWD